MRAGPLAARLEPGRPLVLDGALGTELDRRGVRTYLPLWSALGLIERPEVVADIHRDYAAAGADVLITNTFRTTRYTLEKGGRDGNEAAVLNRLAVEVARAAADAGARHALVAGSIAPVEECYAPGLSPGAAAYDAHREQARQLADAGADFLMIETMPIVAEAEAAARAALETGLEVTVGFVLGDDGRILSGETLAQAVEALRDLPIGAIVVNCSPAAVIADALRALRDLTDLPIGGYANVGTVDATVGWTPDERTDGRAYADMVEPWLEAGAMLVGGCCGTRPEHIAAVRTLVDGWALGRSRSPRF